MKNPSNETVGNGFQADLLKAARDKTLAVISKAAKLIHSGMSEQEANKIVQQIQTEFGAPKSWHARKFDLEKTRCYPSVIEVSKMSF